MEGQRRACAPASYVQHLQRAQAHGRRSGSEREGARMERHGQEERASGHLSYRRRDENKAVTCMEEGEEEEEGKTKELERCVTAESLSQCARVHEKTNTRSSTY